MDIIAIIGVIVAVITFIYQFHLKPKEKLSHLKIQFKATQRLSLQVQEELRKFIEKYDAGDQFLMPGITYQAYLAQMERSFDENLSDRLLKEVESLKPSDYTIDSMLKSLETQFEALSQIDTQLRTILNSNPQ
ncbi:hypothetical protein [Bacteroides thetaiotaomicron]|uniref:hypothetical protein n=1 Tax=Bacteroides thetaiotaomicron TaxID=818 RepID=UPI0039C4D84F